MFRTLTEENCREQPCNTRPVNLLADVLTNHTNLASMSMLRDRRENGHSFECFAVRLNGSWT